jgi:hypothetical protein
MSAARASHGVATNSRSHRRARVRIDPIDAAGPAEAAGAAALRRGAVVAF